ncbi:rifin [Plasmodium falciparum IGH-CR14]|uniref:Rifin n=1 Tax=Plasmodium falciparum IGH-CR14 TaxID=580059 RepID=A0A0L1I4D4_PLAFA|nr:rifin [Plasmodium falciparum IGH-CR14]
MNRTYFVLNKNAKMVPEKKYILVHNKRNHMKTIICTPKTKQTKTHRTLCECELYAPSNYENDSEMKEVMEIFDRQTSERFREYDERMQHKRKQCKEQCEKDIQKIILKDKIEKELTEKFGALQTDIRTEDIPTCVCEKSVADKTEKVCLNCGKTMGAVAPAWGLVSGLGYAGWTHYVSTTVAKAATDAGITKGVKVGLVKVAEIVKQISGASTRIPVIDGAKLITAGKFTKQIKLYDIVKTIDSTMSAELETQGYNEFCLSLHSIVKTPTKLKLFPQQVADVTKAIADGEAGVLADAAPATSSLTTAIIASVVAIVVLVLVMVIIYLILRNRRKKKMKKKYQYIKLLKQ